MNHTIQTYIEFRGDLSSIEVPYNDVDILIFCALSYIDFSYIETKLPLSLKDVHRLMKQNPEYDKKKQYRLYDYIVFEKMEHKKRYEDIKLLSYSDIADEDSIVQFSAITLCLPDDTLVVCYRGTDDTLIGWHEDFNMFLEDTIGARTKACEFLQETGKLTFEESLLQALKNPYYGTSLIERYKHYCTYKKNAPIIVAGHSKGGNLALAASIHTHELHNRIQKVYNFDGPGLPESVSELPGFLEISKKTKAYIPSYSYFGRLFYHGEDQMIVASCNEGMAQHDINSWLVHTNGFIESTLDEEAVNFKKKADDFVERLGQENIKEFIEALFYVFDTLGIKTLTEIETMDIKNLINFFHNLTNLSIKTRFHILFFVQLMHQELRHSKSNIK